MSNTHIPQHGRIARWAGAWDRIFFTQEIPYGLALIRIFLPLALIVDIVRRWPFARELYSTDGATAPLAESFGYPGYLPEFSGTVVVALYTALVFCLFTTMVGWRTRLSLGVVLVLYPYFGMLDCVSSLTKYVVLSSHMILLLFLSRCGSIWSVDAWLNRRSQSVADTAAALRQPPRSSVWPRRLIQLLIAICYFAAAITKLHTPAFFSGDQMQYWMMTYIYYGQPLGDVFSTIPIISIISAYATVIWEILFLGCVWRGWGRTVMLSIGVVFHLATIFMLGLAIFPWIMLVTYFSFFGEKDYQKLFGVLQGLRNRFGKLGANSVQTEESVYQQRPAAAARTRYVFSAGAFVLGIVLFSATGVGLEYQLDRYGLRHPDGLYTLERIPEEEVHQLLRNDQAMREQDKFHSFQIGTRIIGGHLFDQRETFQVGDKIVVQASLNPPHEDLWVEVNLHDMDGKQLSRVGQVAAREHMRVFFNYQLDESFDPGEYDLVLSSSGREISRRRIQLLPSEHKAKLAAPVAN